MHATVNSGISEASGHQGWQVVFRDARLDEVSLSNAEMSPSPSADSLLDLSFVSFLTPFGMLVLHGLIKRLSSVGCLTVQVPNRDVATYLWRMDFHVCLETELKAGTVKFSPEFSAYRFSRKPLKESLLELQGVNAASDEEVTQAEERLWSVIQRRAPTLGALEEQVRIALVEILSNVQRHSGTAKAWVVAQSYAYPVERVEIAIGDVGVGLRHSLSRLHRQRLQQMSDWEVAKFATEPGITGSELGGGTGLSAILEIVREYGGALHLASGHGCYSAYRSSEQGLDYILALPGTVVGVSLVGRSAGRS
ncbi:hypothetical protein HRbin33_00839 [bacterium HR33]|nr:hypothetical protein HRbin33_00839 [bacterium HR33]